jgi:hypothetical protein
LIEINRNLGIDRPLSHPDADRLQTCVTSVIEGKSFGTIIVSSEGLGKTRGIRTIIDNFFLKEHRDWIHIHANVTDSELYKILFDNKDKIIFFDDIGKAAKTPAGITILKQATETKDGKTRIISWNSPTYILNDYPKEFVFEGRLIMCLNTEPDIRDPDIRALLSRILSCMFFPSNKTVLEMLWCLVPVKSAEHNIPQTQVLKIFNFIQKNSTTDNHKINLRLLDKAIMWFKSNPRKWKKFTLEDMELDRDVQTVMHIVNKQQLRGKTAVKEWTRLTGKKKTRFYEVYKNLRKRCIIE